MGRRFQEAGGWRGKAGIFKFKGGEDEEMGVVNWRTVRVGDQFRNG
jgi:hypothetical protein